MLSRRLLMQSSLAGAATLATPAIAAQTSSQAGAVMPTRGEITERPLPLNPESGPGRRPRFRVGIGGTQSGNCFATSTDEETHTKYQAAWDAGVRLFDTSPFYGNGLSERRLGRFLHTRARDDYVLSTKVGRLFTATDTPLPEDKYFKDPAPFAYRFDYSADGARRSVEDSLNRLGVSRLDIVFIHDLSPDNRDLPRPWRELFEEASTGCMAELERMKEQGLITAWGFGVNRPDAAVLAAERDGPMPDICLLATHYSLADHEQAVRRTFPALAVKNISVMVGTPLNGGFLTGRDRFNFDPPIPAPMLEKRQRLAQVCARHGVDLRTAALQFAAAPEIVAAIVPGSRTAAQAQANVASMRVDIPPALWTELRAEGLIAPDAATPA